MIYTSQPDMDKKEQQAVLRVLQNDEMLVGGKQVELLEKEYAEYIGTKYAIAVGSGTAALTLAVRSLKIDGEILTTPVSFVATPESIVLAGAKPRFTDIDKQTWNISMEKLNKNITEDAQAIMPVHLYGLPCDMDRVMEIAMDNNLYVIEDACQAHGAEYKGRKVGAIGDVGCWSFYATKNMTTGGNGGMITTNNKEINDTVRLLREHGGSNNATMIGYNARMNTINAAIGRVQLQKLKYFNSVRKKIASYYYGNLRDTNIGMPVDRDGRVTHLYVVEVKDRDRVRKELYDQGIFCGVHYPKPLHHLEPYEGLETMGLPNAERHCKMNLSLPCHSKMKTKDAVEVVDTLRKVIR